MPTLGPRLLASHSEIVERLASRSEVLLLTTSNRYEKHVWDVPKTTQLARRIEDQLKLLSDNYIWAPCSPIPAPIAR